MMTDIEALKDHGLLLSCINVSCGYYKPHSNEEFVYKPALLNCLVFVEHIIKTCTKVYPHIDNTAYYEKQNYYGDIYDDYYSEIYDLLSNDPSLSFGDIEAMFKDWYGNKINKVELETSYDQAREDILFWNDEKDGETTKFLK